MKTVIFACVHNAGRSQMAAAWFDALADGTRARALSAGTQPGSRVHPEVLEAMREVGIDLSARVPQKLTDDLARGAELLITMGCGEACPVVPGLRRDDWPLEDPKGKSVARVREIRDQVRARVVALLHQEGWGPTPLLRPAALADLPAVLALLDAAALPTAGVAEHFASFQVVEVSGRVVACAGFEVHGDTALLRSLAVATPFRRAGMGAAVLARALDEAGKRAPTVYALTTTAETYLARFGFQRVPRSSLPEALFASRELQDACPASATVLQRVSPGAR